MFSQTQVKVKLLMAFLHLPRRVIEETNAELSEIFEIGSLDEDEWGHVLLEILKYYPSTGILNVNLDQVSPVFAEYSQEIMKTAGAVVLFVCLLFFFFFFKVLLLGDVGAFGAWQ